MIPQLQGSDEWLEWRKTRIGASDASAILGINPWKTPYQLWEEKLGLRDSDTINSRMQRGINLEPKARECFEEMEGTKVEPRVIIHPENEWMVASLDGYGELDGRKFAVEIKCNGYKNHQEAIEGRIPDYYQCQMQHQMAVTGLEWMYYFSYDGERGVIFTLPRNDSFIKILIEKEKEFYKSMVTFCPPPQPYIEKNESEWIELVARWKETKSQIDWLSSQEESLRGEIISLTKGENCRGGGIKVSKEIRKGTVDYKSIPELAAVDLDKYRKRPTECWKITQDKENNGKSDHK